MEIQDLARAIDEVWIVIAAILVMFMQAGFALVEAGFTRAKNAGNIIMKNVMDFSIGGIVYWAVGFGLAYGGTNVGGFFGWGDGFFFNDVSRSSEWFFQVVFAATAATIMSGAIAGRTKFKAYLMITPFITGLIYPVVTHWVWTDGGWLADLGFVDFAGSGVVHLLGGVAALAGVIVVGPRIGKFAEDGTPQSIPGHSLVLGALGVLILWFGWYGFNAGSTLVAVGADIATPAVTTTLAAGAGALSAMFMSWKILGHPDVGFTLNGVLAGLVSITAGANSLSFGVSILVGAIGAGIMIGAVLLLEKVRLDDPVGAIAVHGAAGMWGVLAVGIFNSQVSIAPQVIGIAAIVTWTFITSFAVFKLVDRLVGVRVSREEELHGLDLSEHRIDVYPEFVFQDV
ncbi:MAG: ammonium transporter [Acidobacteria bacterium]|nr:ammonium transporter [Acidobacteriota bacterium]